MASICCWPPEQPGLAIGEVRQDREQVDTVIGSLLALPPQAGPVEAEKDRPIARRT